MGTSVGWTIRWTTVSVALLAALASGTGSLLMTFMSYADPLAPTPSAGVTPAPSMGALTAVPILPADTSPTPSASVTATTTLMPPIGVTPVPTPPPSALTTPRATPELQASPLVPISSTDAATATLTPAASPSPPAAVRTRAPHTRQPAAVAVPFVPLELAPSVAPEPGSVPLDPEFVPQFGPPDEDWPEVDPDNGELPDHTPPAVDAAPAWSPLANTAAMANHLIVSGAAGLLVAVTGVALLVTRRRRW